MRYGHRNPGLKGPFLYSVLFEEGNKGYHDRATLIYRDIIFKYSHLVKKEDQPTSHAFKDYELANWLLDNNQDFNDRYTKDPDRHTNKSSQLKNIIRKIQGRIDDLIKLGLMKRAGTAKQEKGTGPVFLYEFTRYTYLLLALLRSNSEESADEEVFNIYQLILNDKDAPSINILYFNLFNKFKERGLYSEFVIYPLTEAFFTNRTARHITELLFDNHRTDDVGKIMTYNALLSETLKEMADDARLRVLLILRDEIERNIVSKGVRSLKDYEEALLRSKQSPQTLAVESHCDRCKTYVWAIVDVIEYLDAVSLPTDDPLKKNCPTCGKYSLVVPKILLN